jgi:hypothetical protein
VIRDARFGFCPAVSIPTHDGDRFYRASGVVIPWLTATGLALVKIRQPRDAKPKYAEAYRDSAALEAAGWLFTTPATVEPGRPVIITEGELDALCLASLLGDAAAVVTLGSAAIKPTPATLAHLLVAPHWYAAMDADEAGERAAAAWPARVRRVRPPEGTGDWCEAHARDLLSLWRVWHDALGRPESMGLDVDPYTILERLAIIHENR